MALTERQKQMVLELLWGSLKQEPAPDRKWKRRKPEDERRQTGWGTKTRCGLCACIGRIFDEGADPEPNPEPIPGFDNVVGQELFGMTVAIGESFGGKR